MLSTDLSLSGTTLNSNMLTFTVDQLEHRADGDGEGGPGQRRGQRHRNADAHRLGRGLRQRHQPPTCRSAVTDDDTPAIVLSETDVTVTEGDAAGSSYTVKLVTQPTGSVNVTISGHDGTDLSAEREPR